MLLDDIARDHPALPILIEHMGGMAMFDEALAVLMNNTSLFAGYTMETGPMGRFPSSALRGEQIQTLRHVAGSARIIYGLGYPWNSDNRRALRDDIAEIRAWGWSDDDEARVLGGIRTPAINNAARRFRAAPAWVRKGASPLRRRRRSQRWCI